jgi:hypothetical protein
MEIKKALLLCLLLFTVSMLGTIIVKNLLGYNCIGGFRTIQNSNCH